MLNCSVRRLINKARPQHQLRAGPIVVRSGHDQCRETPPNPYYDPRHGESIWGRNPRCKTGYKHLVTMSGGVGVGPELMEVVKRVFRVANAPVVFEEVPMGADADDTDMDNLIYSVERNGVAIKGNIEKALEPMEISRNMQMRRALDLYVNLVEIKSYPEIVNKTRLRKAVDVALVRQNTEGEFAMLEHEYSNGRGVEHLKITTEYNTTRLAEFAFEYALKHKRPSVIVVHRKGIMPNSEALFLDVIGQVAKRYPDIDFRRVSLKTFVFNMAKFEFNGQVLVLNSMYGGLVMALLFGLMNGQGLYCGQNLGSRYAVFEPAARQKGYKLAGKDVANPVAALDCGVKLLRHLGHARHADIIQRAVELTVGEDGVSTADVFGSASSSRVVRNVERRVREAMPEGHRDEAPPQLPPTPPPTPPFQP